MPEEKTNHELLAEKIESLISVQNEQENSDYIALPQDVEGKKIHWHEETEIGRAHV